MWSRMAGTGLPNTGSQNTGHNRPRIPSIFLAAALLVGGCAEVSLVSHAAKQTVGRASDESRPGYKVGQPYQINGIWYHPKEDPQYDATGIASWYGDEFRGRPTANGEIYNPNDLTAAHQTLPMPSFVRVTNLENGRSIVVRVNDRGPFSGTRIIDMSRRSAQLLGFDRKGTARVRVQAVTSPAGDTLVARAEGAGAAGDGTPGNGTISPSVSMPSGSKATTPPGGSPRSPPAAAAPLVQQGTPQRTALFIQAGAFSRYESAQRVSRELSRYGNTKVSPTKTHSGNLYRVRLGPLQSVEHADRTLAALQSAGYSNARIIVD